MKISSGYAADTGEGLIRRSARKAFHIDVCVQNSAADSHGFDARNGSQASQQLEEYKTAALAIDCIVRQRGRRAW